MSSFCLLIVTTATRNRVCFAAALNEHACCQLHWFLGTKSAWVCFQILTSCSKCQHNFTYFKRDGASAEGPFGEGGSSAKGRVTILLPNFFLPGNKGTERSEMYKLSLRILKKMPHLGNFPFLSRVYFLVSSFTVWNAGTETESCKQTCPLL